MIITVSYCLQQTFHLVPLEKLSHRAYGTGFTQVSWFAAQGAIIFLTGDVYVLNG